MHFLCSQFHKCFNRPFGNGISLSQLPLHSQFFHSRIAADEIVISGFDKSYREVISCDGIRYLLLQPPSLSISTTTTASQSASSSDFNELNTDGVLMPSLIYSLKSFIDGSPYVPRPNHIINVFINIFK